MNHRRQTAYFGAVIVLMLTAWLGSVGLANANRLHPDEAFFLTFARQAAVQGDWWLSGSLDKPPLTHYINALLLMTVAVDQDTGGVLQLDVYKGEFAGRLAAYYSGVLLAALTMALVYQQTRQVRRALFAGVMMALSPYRIAFAPTVFTDMPMLTLALAAVVAAGRDRPMWAGVLLGLSVAAKPQGIAYAPLVMALLPLTVTHWRRLILGGLLVVAPLLVWDAMRAGTSVFLLGTVNNTPSSSLFSPLIAWPARAAQVSELGAYLLGDGLITIGLIVTGLMGAMRARLWWAWLVVMIGALIVTNGNIYDRYLLLILPVLVTAITISLPAFDRRSMRLGLTVIIIASGVSAWQAHVGLVPIGGDGGQHDGIDELADYLNAKPVARVIYDRWLGWELGYYMGAWSDKRRVYYPTPATMAQGARNLDEIGSRYFVAPEWEIVTPWLMAFESVGFSVTIEHRIGAFTVYEVNR